MVQQLAQASVILFYERSIAKLQGSHDQSTMKKQKSCLFLFFRLSSKCAGPKFTFKPIKEIRSFNLRELPKN